MDTKQNTYEDLVAQNKRLKKDIKKLKKQKRQLKMDSRDIFEQKKELRSQVTSILSQEMNKTRNRVLQSFNSL